MTTHHTPGPWATAAPQHLDLVTGPDGARICSTFAPKRSAQECEANALLIATAPDMLAELKACEDLLTGVFPHAPRLADMVRTRIDAIRAIIAKAECGA